MRRKWTRRILILSLMGFVFFLVLGAVFPSHHVSHTLCTKQMHNPFYCPKGWYNPKGLTFRR